MLEEIENSHFLGKHLSIYIRQVNEKSNQVKVCDSTVHACILNTDGNIVQYTLYSTMF